MFSPRPVSWRIAGIRPASPAPSPSDRTLHRRPQPQRLGYRRVGIVGQIGRAFQTDITVSALRLLVNRTQHIGSGANIGNRQMLVDFGNAVVGLRLELFQRIGIFVALADCLFKIEGFDVCL